jgi:hypothetical protein
MGVNTPDQPGRDDRSPPGDTSLSGRFDGLVRNVTVTSPRIDKPLPLEPAFDAATDLHPGLLEARPKLYMLEEFFGYTASDLENVASRVGVAAPVRLLSKTGVEKFRELVRQFRARGLVVSEKNPDRDAARGCTFHSRFLFEFMSDTMVLDYFSRVAGIELIPLPIRYNQVQINMLPAYDPDAGEPGFGIHIDSTNFACILDITEDRDIQGGALQHALMTREQFFTRSGSRDNVAYAYLHMVLPEEELLSTRFDEEGSAVFQQGSLVPHQVENVRKVRGTRDTVAFTLHPANPMVRRFDFFSAASTWNSPGIREDIGNILAELADRRIEAIDGALELAEDIAGTADALPPRQLRELQAGRQNAEQLKREAEQFLVDLADGVDDISCPDDTFRTPSVFNVSYKG